VHCSSRPVNENDEGHRLSSFNKIVELGMLSDQVIAVKLAITAIDDKIRETVVNKYLNDADALKKAALEDRSSSIRISAIEKLKDPKTLALSAVNDKDSKVRIASIIKI
jgi:uncharacterized Fe-S cluster-containing MiaB family protein